MNPLASKAPKSRNRSQPFFTRKSDLTSRWDPAYFRPELVRLETRVNKVARHRLRDFVLRTAGGATPPTTDADLYYTESADGVPFIRVQNLSTTGRLDLSEYKRITRSTHEGLLARSRVFGGELLVKITGVGRMAVATVVPSGLEANINQHIVALKTKDATTSATLAAYLNLDVAEKLASRRSTGGTRPALDYPALLSIPVIFDARVPAMVNDAVNAYEEMQAKARAMLEDIDQVILAELGIHQPPATPSTIHGRVFRSNLSKVTGRRWDPNHLRTITTFLGSLHSGLFPACKLKGHVALIQYGISERATEDSTGVPILRMLNLQDGEWDLTDMKFIVLSEREKLDYLLQPGDILLNRTNSKELVGKCNVFDLHGEYVFASYLLRIRIKDENVLRPAYLVAYLGSSLGRAQIDAVSRQIIGMSNINAEEVRDLLLPLPPPSVQDRICRQVNDRRQRAAALRAKAAARLEDAQKSICTLILGKEAVE